MIRSITSALAKRRAIYRKRVKAFLKDYPVCAVFSYLKSTQCHHKFGRRGKLLLWEPGWVAVSNQGHTFINNNPKAARTMGLLAPLGQWNTMPKEMNAIKPTQRLVRRNSTETVKHLMFLFGVKAVPHPEFAEAVFVIADKWQEGFEDGMALQKKKPSLFRSIRKILRSKNQPNDQAQPRGPTI